MAAPGAGGPSSLLAPTGPACDTHNASGIISVRVPVPQLVAGAQPRGLVRPRKRRQRELCDTHASPQEAHTHPPSPLARRGPSGGQQREHWCTMCCAVGGERGWMKGAEKGCQFRSGGTIGGGGGGVLPCKAPALSVQSNPWLKDLHNLLLHVTQPPARLSAWAPRRWSAAGLALGGPRP